MKTPHAIIAGFALVAGAILVVGLADRGRADVNPYAEGKAEFLASCKEAIPEAPEKIVTPICAYYEKLGVNRPTAFSLARLEIRLSMMDGKALDNGARQ